MLSIDIIVIMFIISISSWIITTQIDPLEYIKEYIGIGRIRKLKSNYLIIDWILYTIWKLNNCAPCLSFWTSMIYFYSINGIFYSILIYGLTSYLVNKLNTFTL